MHKGCFLLASVLNLLMWIKFVRLLLFCNVMNIITVVSHESYYPSRVLR